jgi:hypothetical protein
MVKRKNWLNAKTQSVGCERSLSLITICNLRSGLMVAAIAIWLFRLIGRLVDHLVDPSCLALA